MRGSAGLREDFHPPSHEEFSSLRMGEATPPSPFPFPVKFRVVSLDKDLTPSNQKVRAGLGRGEVTRAPSQPAVGEVWESPFPLGMLSRPALPRELPPGQGCPVPLRGAAESGRRKQRARVTRECAHASSQPGMQPW